MIGVVFLKLFSFLFKIDSAFERNYLFDFVLFFLSQETPRFPSDPWAKRSPRTAATPRKYMVFGTESRDAQVLNRF